MDDKLSAEILRYEAIWRERSPAPISNSAKNWNARATEWIVNLDGGNVRARSMNGRVNVTAEYLRSRGLLGENDAVVDVGCGPGLFVLEFAKTAKQAVGIDYSEKFMSYAREKAAEENRANASFLVRDFDALDLDAEGLRGKFDLAFSSITPAVSEPENLRKLIAMSRAYCYNSSFVYERDELLERISLDVFGEKFKSRRDGAGFHALFNLLWLYGFYPETHYFEEVREEIFDATEENADYLARRCNQEDGAQKVLRWLERTGIVTRRSTCGYGCLLWDVRIKDARD